MGVATRIAALLPNGASILPQIAPDGNPIVNGKEFTGEGGAPPAATYKSAFTGEMEPLSDPVTAADRLSFIKNQEANGDDGSDDHHVVVDVNMNHAGTVMTLQRKTSPGVTARVKTVTAMTNTGWVTN